MLNESQVSAQSVKMPSELSTPEAKALKPKDSNNNKQSVEMPSEPSTPTAELLKPTDSNNNKYNSIDIWESSWNIVVRPCHWYREEYSECKSIKGRFHQYFIHGSTQDCQQWKKDYDNCVKYEKNKDQGVKKEILESEYERFKNRIGASLNNNTWTLRQSPPPDWNKPLPDFLIQRQKDSFFQQYDSGKESEESSMCSIM